MAVKVTRVYEIDVIDRSLGGLLKSLRALRDAGVPLNAVIVNTPDKLVVHLDQVTTASEILDALTRPQ